MRRLVALLLLAALPAQGPAQTGQVEEIEVDVELALMVDVSRSMTPHEVDIQRRGYAAAILSDPVMTAVQSGLLGAIAVTYVEWAGDYTQRVIVPWTVIQTRADAEAFADALGVTFGGGLRRTSISGAIGFAAEAFQGNGFAGLRQVIDVSGDGPNNSGGPVLAARDAALARGITINGLPLMTNEGMGGAWQIEELDAYYRDCVIGGPGAFMIPVLDWEEFEAAVRRKLVLEIVGLPPGLQPDHRAESRVIQAQAGGADCLIGEKMWDERRRYWEEP